MIDLACYPVLRPEIADSRRIRVGAAMKRPLSVPAAVADTGKIRLGAAMRHFGPHK